MNMTRQSMKAFRNLAAAVAVGMAALAASAGTITYYHNDFAGSPVAATNESGQVVWRESYRPYGERLVHSAASSGNDIWFTSRRQDAETGLVYMGARYYDPVAGRFVSPDPVIFDEKNIHSFNRYAYANNNPYKYSDPDGREVRIVGHLALWPFGMGTNPDSYHLALWLNADDKSYSPMTVGGQWSFGSLTAAFNYPGDALSKAEFSQVVPTPVGMTDAQFIDNIVKAARRHDDTTQYTLPDVIPMLGVVDAKMSPGTYNSNSFVSGVLEAAGATPPFINFPTQGQVPGYDNPVPIRPGP